MPESGEDKALLQNFCTAEQVLSSATCWTVGRSIGMHMDFQWFLRNSEI